MIPIRRVFDEGAPQAVRLVSEMSVAIDPTAPPTASLPPGQRLPPVAQAVLRIWRYVEFRERCYARYGDTCTLRIGGLPTSVLTRDRDAIRRLFTGDPLIKRHGNDLLRMVVGERRHRRRTRVVGELN